MLINIMISGSAIYDHRNSIAKNREPVPVSDKNASMPNNEPVVTIFPEIISLNQLLHPAPQDITGQSANNINLLALTCDLRRKVEMLGCGDSIAQALVNEALSWNKFPGGPLMEGCKISLDKARADYGSGKICISELTDIETKIIAQLGIKIKSEFRPNDQIFELPEVLRSRQAQCVSYTQMVLVVASGLGFSVQGVNVSNMLKPLSPAEGHVVGLVGIADMRSVFVDLTQDPLKIVSQPFSLGTRYEKDGNYLRVKPEYEAMVEMYRYKRIQLLGLNGLIACTFLNRGVIAHRSGKYQQAIANYDTAISLDPRSAEAFCYRGTSYYYADSGNYERAIANYDTAIRMNPEFLDALNGRGGALIKSGQIEKGEEDLNRAKEILKK